MSVRQKCLLFSTVEAFEPESYKAEWREHQENNLCRKAPPLSGAVGNFFKFDYKKLAKNDSKFHFINFNSIYEKKNVSVSPIDNLFPAHIL